jgi:HlyD family secretion protein
MTTTVNDHRTIGSMGSMSTSFAMPGTPETDAELLAEITKKRRSWGWFVVMLLSLVAIGAIVYRSRTTKKSEPRYVTSRVTHGEVIESIEATGTVQPLLSVQVGAQVSGRILRVHTDFNRTVREGELLAELDPEPFRTRVNEARGSQASAQAALARARADLAIKERDLARARELRARGLNSQAELDAAIGAWELARASVLVAQADVARTTASLASAQTQLEQSRIFSPISGIVISRQVDPGQTVAASLQAPTLFVIAQDLTHMRVIADIDEADVGRVREGMSVDVRVEAFQGERFRGTITQLRFGSTTTAGVVTYPAVIEVPNPEMKLRPGMTATVTVTTARIERALRVPNAALRYRPSSNSANHGGDHDRWRDREARVESQGPSSGGDGRVGAEDGFNSARMGRVYILRGGQPTPARVRIIATDGTFTAVESSELREGMEVVIDEVNDGDSGTAARDGTGRGGSRGPRLF